MNKASFIFIAIAIMAGITHQQTTSGAWDNEMLTSYNQMWKQDKIQFDATDVFITEGLVTNFDSLKNEGEFTHVEIQPIFTEEHVNPVNYTSDGKCMMSTHVYAHTREQYYVLCNNDTVVPLTIAQGSNEPTPGDAYNLQEKSAFNRSVCSNIIASGDGSHLFIFCSDETTPESHGLEFLAFRANATNQLEFVAQTNFTDIFAETIQDPKMSIYGKSMDDGFTVVINNRLDSGKEFAGYAFNIKKGNWDDNGPFALDPKEFDNYPQGNGLSVINLESDGERMFLITREKKNDIVEEEYLFRIAICEGDLNKQMKPKCMNKTDVIFGIKEPEAVIAQYSVGFNIYQSKHQQKSGDVIMACGNKARAGSISYLSGRFTDKTGIINIEGISAQDKGHNIESFWVQNKIYINWQDIASPGSIRIINQYSLTSMNITNEQMAVFGNNAGYFSIKLDDYDTDSALAVYFTDNKVYTKNIYKPTIRLTYPDVQPTPLIPFSEVKSRLVAKIYGTDEPFYSDDILFKVMNSYAGMPSFGKLSQDSFGYAGSYAHLPSFHSELIGNSITFMTAFQEEQKEKKMLRQDNPAPMPLDMNVRYAGEDMLILDERLKNYFTNNTVTQLVGTAGQYFMAIATGDPNGNNDEQAPANHMIVAGCEANPMMGTNTCGLNSILFDPDFDPTKIKDAIIFKRWALITYSTDTEGQESMFSAFNLFSFIPEKPRNAVIQKGFTISSATHFVQGDTVVIFMTGKLDQETSDSLYYIEVNSAILERSMFEIVPNKVEVPQIESLCPTRMIAMPNADQNYYRFIVDSKCSGEKKDLDKKLYQFSFFIQDPSQAFIEKTYSLVKEDTPDFCVSKDWVHIIDLVPEAERTHNGPEHRLISVPTNPRDVSVFDNDLAAYNITTLNGIVCNADKGSLHVFATRTNSTGGSDNILVNYNGYNPTNPSRRIHSMIKVPDGTTGFTSLYNYNTDEVSLIGFVEGEHGFTVKETAFYVALSGPHITLSGKVIEEETVLQANLTFFSGFANEGYEGKKEYNVKFLKPQREASMKLKDSKKRMDLTQASGTQGGSLKFSDWFDFFGPVRQLYYDPVYIKAPENKNKITQRLTPLSDDQNPWKNLKQEYSGFTINGQFIITWGEGKIQMWQNSFEEGENSVTPCGGALNGTVIEADIYDLPTQAIDTVAGFAIYTADSLDKRIAVWTMNEKYECVLSTGSLPEENMLKTKFVVVPLVPGSTEYNYMMVSANNQGVPRLVYNQLTLSSDQGQNIVTVSEYNKDVTFFDFPVIDFDANLVKDVVVVTAFIHATKGTYAEAVTFDTTFDEIYKFGQGYGQILKDSTGDKFGGHLSDHYGSLINCIVVSDGSTFFEPPALGCTYTTPGVFTYSTTISLNLDGSRSGSSSLIVEGGSFWNEAFMNPPGYLPVASHRSLTYTAVILGKKSFVPTPSPQFSQGTDPLNSSFLLVVYDSRQNTTNVGQISTPFAFLTAEDLEMSDYDYNKLIAQITPVAGNPSIVVNLAKNGTGKATEIKVINVNELEFNIKDYTQISPMKDSLKITSYVDSQDSIPIKSLMFTDADPADGGNGGKTNNTFYIIVIVVLILASAGIIGFLIYQKQNSEKKFTEDFEKEAEEIGAGEDDKAETLLTKSEFSRM
jgi:hypothetical protein